MKQVLQSLQTGSVEVAEVPPPRPRQGQLLIASHLSLLSVGTERMMIEFGRAGWINKARQQPAKVRQVLEKVKTDGLLPTISAVRSKLEQPLALGYCNVGEVIAVGAGVHGFNVGDRVASNGKHAEIVSVSANLCARIPDGVSDQMAAFTVVSAIGLQGIRLIQPTLGERIVVTGLGLIGLLTVQLLRAQGCEVLGIDFDAGKLALARQFGAQVVDLSAGVDPIAAAEAFSRGRGVDAVLIAASTQSNDPMHQAAQMCRKRGRIVLVGVTGLELSRADFYEKELSFQVSCSYGPGRYDPAYEEHGNDYPVGYVRWTEQRNFEAVLDQMAQGRIATESLISHNFPIDQAQAAYEVLATDSKALGIGLEYSASQFAGEAGQVTVAAQRTVVLVPLSGFSDADKDPVDSRAGLALVSKSGSAAPQPVSIGFIGSGNYAGAVLIPAFKATGARMRCVVSANGVSGLHAGRKFGFETTSSDKSAVLSDSVTNTVVIATRHDSHASLVLEAMAAAKNVFVEKPLALNREELQAIEDAYTRINANKPVLNLMVGFNRRFAPQVVALKRQLTATSAAKVMIMTVNAGSIPGEHWTQDPETGGGRILGEACHFIDLLRHLAGAPIRSWTAQKLGTSGGNAGAMILDDKATINLQFEDGSMGTIHYLANGNKAFPKERLEVFCDGKIAQLDNFRSLRAFSWPGLKNSRLWRQDKGQGSCAAAFVDSIKNHSESPISFAELLEVGRVTIDIAQHLRHGT